jgi:hypothetical protein
MQMMIIFLEFFRLESAFKAIPAIIDGNQKVASGGVVKLRLQDTIRINGISKKLFCFLFNGFKSLN